MLLSANVGFLSINTVDSFDTSAYNKSAAQIASYISAILSLSIYIVCQILTRHHRHHAHSHADWAVSFHRECFVLHAERNIIVELHYYPRETLDWVTCGCHRIQVL